jgi:hypothetical protein
MTIRFVPLIAIALFVVACPKKEESKEGAFSQTAAQPAQAASQPARAASQPAQAASQPGMQQAAPDAPPFSGEIKLGTGLPADSVKPTDVLFVIARQSIGGQPGQIIATQRHAPVVLPVKFTISRRDTMVEGIPFTGPWIVTARLDRDGDAMTKDENDLYAVSAGEVKGGQSNVTLMLTKGMPQQPNQAPASQPAR